MNVTPTRTSAAIEVAGVNKRFGAVAVLHGVDLQVAAGKIVALLGPSGCGKTTLLRIIAGLETPDGGEVRVGGRTVTGPQVFVPPERRRVGMVFQDWALFPHLTVARNVGYGIPRADGRTAHARRIDGALELVGLQGLGDRLPATLSGGQQQRVALARALAPEPSAVLLDEPFSNLDTTLRAQVRGEVHRLLTNLGVTCVFVTHDQEEAFVMGDEVAVINAGRVIQQATPAELYAHPATPWVATFVGEANLLVGRGRGATAETVLGSVPLGTRHQGEMLVLVRPEHLRLEPGPGGLVELVEYYGHDVVYLIRLDSGLTLRIRAGPTGQFHRGDQVAVGYVGPPAVAFGR